MTIRSTDDGFYFFFQGVCIYSTRRCAMCHLTCLVFVYMQCTPPTFTPAHGKRAPEMKRKNNWLPMRSRVNLLCLPSLPPRTYRS